MVFRSESAKGTLGKGGGGIVTHTRNWQPACRDKRVRAYHLEKGMQNIKERPEKKELAAKGEP